MTKSLESQWSVLTEHQDPTLMEDSAHMNSIQGYYLGIWLEKKLHIYNHVPPNAQIAL